MVIMKDAENDYCGFLADDDDTTRELKSEADDDFRRASFREFSGFSVLISFTSHRGWTDNIYLACYRVYFCIS